MNGPPRVHVHLAAWTDEPWDLEESLFSLVTQDDVVLTVSLAVPAALEAFSREACGRLARLGRAVTFSASTPSGSPPGVEAVAVWVAGTVATRDHLSRSCASSGEERALTVAPARRVLRRPVAGRPPYIVGKRRRFTSARPSLQEVGRDPAFLGRWLVPGHRAPGWLPVSPEEHRRWAAEAWRGGPVTRVSGPPTVDLPDLRTHRIPRSIDDIRDALADLRYQAPRWLERSFPLAFSRLRSVYHRLRTRAH